MRSLFSLLLTLLSIVPLFLASGDSAQAQGVKLGWINDNKIQAGYPEWTRAQEQMDIEMKAWDDEAAAKKTELEELLADYDKQKLILSEEKKKEREATLRVKKDALDAFTRQVYGPNGSAETKQMELIKPLLDKINQAIQLVAEEGGYDVVFTLQSNLGYIKPSYDLTDKVLAKLETLEQ
jgi:outer membrane protein